MYLLQQLGIGNWVLGDVFLSSPTPSKDDWIPNSQFFVGIFEKFCPKGANFVGFFEEKIRTPLFKNLPSLRGCG